VGIGKNPLINGITSTETLCVIELGGNVMTSMKIIAILIIKVCDIVMV